MELKGNIYVTTDFNVALQNSINFKIVSIGELDPSSLQTLNAIKGSVIIPPYIAFESKMNGDEVTFNNIYIDYLNQKEPTSYISAIIAALYQGKNIMLYLTQDEFDMYFINFWNYVKNMYGVTIGFGNIQPSFESSFTWIVCSMLYKTGMLTPQEFLELYPSGAAIPDDLIPKLAEQLNGDIYLNDTSFESYKQYFYNLKESIKRNNNIYMESPIRRV